MRTTAPTARLIRPPIKELKICPIPTWKMHIAAPDDDHGEEENCGLTATPVMSERQVNDNTLERGQ